MEPKQKALVLGVAGLLLIPVGWSRVLFHDHSWDQVLVGAVVGTLLAVIWYGFLTSRLAWWLIKLLKAWVPFVEVNYPIDGAVLEPVEPGLGSSNSSVLSPVGEDLPESAVRGTTEDAAEKPGLVSYHSVSLPSDNTTSTTTAAASFTIDMSQVKRLHLVGRDNLKRSDCYGAAHYFNLSRALFLKLEPQANLTAPSGLHFTLVADHGFALICARRFEEAMTLLLGCLNGTLQCSSYLMNAIGYAFWQLQETLFPFFSDLVAFPSATRLC
eukprot:g10101.t1